MYPLCCIDIRNFLNQFYFFANDDFAHPTVIDDTLKDVSMVFGRKKLKRYLLLTMSRPLMISSPEKYAIRWSNASPHNTLDKSFRF